MTDRRLSDDGAGTRPTGVRAGDPTGGPPALVTPRVVTIVAGLVVVGVVVVALGALRAIGLAVATALLAAAPGYLLVRALVPDGRLSRLEIALASVGASVSLTILVGVGLSLAGVALTAQSWVLALVALSILFAALAWRRGAGRGIAWRGGAGRARPADLSRVRVAALTGAVRPIDAGLVAVGVLLALAAVGIASFGATTQPAGSFTELWLVPAASADTVRVGLQSEETGLVAYRVVLEAGSQVVGDWSPRVARGGEWDETVAVPPGSVATLQALLFFAGSPGQAYRTATLSLASPAPSASPQAPTASGSAAPGGTP